MRRSNRWADHLAPLRARLLNDAGSASVEFLTVGVVLLVPLVYLVLSLGQIQHAVLGVEGGARHAARAIAQADAHDAGLAVAVQAIAVAITDAGLTPDAVAVSIRCNPDPNACDTPRGTVTVELAATVPLPLLPPMVAGGTALGVPIAAQAMQPVSAFAGAP